RAALSTEARRTSSVPRPARRRSTGARRAMRSDVARTFAAKVYSRTEGIVGGGVRALGPVHVEQSALRLAHRERRLDGLLVHLSVSPGSFANQVGGANVIDHENIWATFPLYPRIVYTIGDAQCHQLFYRSFWLNGNQMPIDERMTSMYVFANLGVVAAMFARP